MVCHFENLGTGKLPLGHNPLFCHCLNISRKEELIKEQGEAELTCRFCQEQYRFTKEELVALRNQISKDQHTKQE
jgi:hypothetical protein